MASLLGYKDSDLNGILSKSIALPFVCTNSPKPNMMIKIHQKKNQIWPFLAPIGIISYYYFCYFIANQNNENYLRDRVVKALPWANKSYLLVDTLLLSVGRYAMLLLVRRYEDFYPCVFAITPTSNQHLGKLLVNNWDCTRNYRNWLENV